MKRLNEICYDKSISNSNYVTVIGESVDYEKTPPQKIIKGYKLFRKKDDKIYPLFVDRNKPIEMGKWLSATPGPQNAAGKVKSSLGVLAYRPGWHSGDLPIATHIGGKSKPGLKAPDYRPDNHVWAEVEHPADRDWQTEANKRARVGKDNKPVASTAHITDQVPHNGYYKYKTNANMKGSWIISGGMKVNRILDDAEVEKINKKHGVADLPRKANK